MLTGPTAKARCIPYDITADSGIPDNPRQLFKIGVKMARLCSHSVSVSMSCPDLPMPSGAVWDVQIILHNILEIFVVVVERA